MFATALSLVSGCTTPSKTNDNLDSFLSSMISRNAPMFDVLMLKHGSIDLLYDCTSFRHKNGRWPNDYAELSTFVKQSNGYLTLGEYELVELRPLADGSLEVCYVRHGQTEETKFTLGDILNLNNR
jgi:hypothetical protein